MGGKPTIVSTGGQYWLKAEKWEKVEKPQKKPLINISLRRKKSSTVQKKEFKTVKTWKTLINLHAWDTIIIGQLTDNGDVKSILQAQWNGKMGGLKMGKKK